MWKYVQEKLNISVSPPNPLLSFFHLLFTFFSPPPLFSTPSVHAVHTIRETNYELTWQCWRCWQGLHFYCQILRKKMFLINAVGSQCVCPIHPCVSSHCIYLFFFIIIIIKSLVWKFVAHKSDFWYKHYQKWKWNLSIIHKRQSKYNFMKEWAQSWSFG